MNKTKKIYFLAAFVMIIGCYALNKSYSLFVATEQQEAVTSKVPILESSLSISTITLASNEECLIKQTINNTSEVPINYALNAIGTNYNIKMTSDEGNRVLGYLEPNKSNIVYLYVKNNSTSTNTISFELIKKYTTLNNDLTSNIDSTNLYTPVTVTTMPYQNEPNTLKYHILYNYVNSDLYAGSEIIENNTTAAEAFSGKTENKIKLPLSNGTIELPKLTEMTNIETEEKGLYQATDDYGTTYYFRGASTKNYVTFANKTWRIVRINGDGSIRLVLDDVAKNSSGSVISTAFNTNFNDNAYVGYMYGTPGSTTYDATHENINDSTIKQKVDKWYEDNLKTNYANYLADALFCNDKTLASSSIGSGNTALGYGRKTTYYATVERLEYSRGTTSITTSKPTFKCAENANNTYSRFTVDVITLPNGKQTNGNLKYPIGLLTADEAAFAGAYKFNQKNKNYYLYNSNITTAWWLSSPNELYNDKYAYEFHVDGSDGSISSFNVEGTDAFRPSINLKADLLVSGGDGTSTNPYTVEAR